ncbi:hypothetical protein BDE02_11G044900 [Populus trichocarpa]|nr:hypothetical protein BDE02_11G044900 [Populus trichocarpa]
MESFPCYSFQSLAEVALLQIEATLSSGHSQLLKTMKELTANSTKDALGPESLTNLMTTKGVAENHDKQIAISVFTSQFYSHSKHYYPLLLTFQTLHNPLISYKNLEYNIYYN